MKIAKTYVTLAVFIVASFSVKAQCEIFKSEITEVQEYMLEVSILSDSLRPASEIAAFDSKFNTARSHAKDVQFLMGLAVTAAYEAADLAAEAQYNSQNCGIGEVVSYTIDAEKHAIDARDFADEAYENVKSAVKAKNLGNLQYYMRIAQRIIKESREAADASAYAAELAHYSCTHTTDSYSTKD